MSAKEKNLEGFLQVYEEIKGSVFRTAMRYSNNNYHVAQEITQEVFIKLYENFDTYQEEYLLQWALMTARNMSLNYNKKSAREIPDQDITLTSELRESVPGTEVLVFERLDGEEKLQKREHIFDTLYKINVRWYEAMKLVYIADMKQKEVAEKIGISLGALEAMLYRARKKVKEKFKYKEE